MEEIFNTDIGRKILALTKASFRVSDLISDLVFREKIKHQVLNVYEKFLTRYDLINNTDLLKEIDILEHYFYLGHQLNVVKEEHLKQLQNGFLVFKSHIILLNNNTNGANENTRMTRSVETEFPLVENFGSSVSNNLTVKQKKILEKFEDKDTLKLAEISELFPGVSEKTVRNELASLVSVGKITRSGIGNGSFYKLVK